ncbi:hypothetical protein KCU93_g300, partial [Aureobasidium melanogenum]
MVDVFVKSLVLWTQKHRNKHGPSSQMRCQMDHQNVGGIRGWKEMRTRLRTFGGTSLEIRVASLRREKPIKGYLNGQTRICIATVHFDSFIVTGFSTRRGYTEIDRTCEGISSQDVKAKVDSDLVAAVARLLQSRELQNSAVGGGRGRSVRSRELVEAWLVGKPLVRSRSIQPRAGLIAKLARKLLESSFELPSSFLLTIACRTTLLALCS